MTTVTATANSAATNVFDSVVLQAITSGTLGSHNSTQFVFSNEYFILTGHGSGFGYSGGHPSSGTMTSLEFQLSTGTSSWSGFSVSVSSVWSAVSTGNVAAFGNLFFSGNDTFNMQQSNGQDNLAGGAGNDIFNYAGNLSELTYIDGGSGTNTLNLNGSYYIGSDPFRDVSNIQIVHLSAGHTYDLTLHPTSALTVDGSALHAADFVNYQTEANASVSITITGGAGNDTFVSGGGNDTFNAGAGSDMLDLSRATGGLTIDLNQTSVHGAGIGTDTFSSVENAVGTQYNDIFIGNASDNTFVAVQINSFVDVGVDSFDGGAGNDSVSFIGYGGGGTHHGLTIDLRGGDSHIAGTDTFTSIEKVTGSEFDDTFYGNSADNIFDGSDGTDTIDYSAATSAMTFNMPNNDTIVVSGGGQGSDTLSGFEHIAGTQFDDTFFLVFDPLDYFPSISFDGGAGTDTISLQNATSGVFVDLSHLGTSIEHMIGSSFNDTLAVDDFSAIIDGGGGDDTIEAHSGDDTLSGDDGNDTITGGRGNDIVNGGAGDDIVCGGGDFVYEQTEGNDILNGGDGNDTLYANDQYDVNWGGDCTFDGGAGDDQINGSTGNDTASYEDATSGVTVSLNVVGPQAVGGGDGSDTLFSIENLRGSNFNDRLIGGGVANVLSGLGGNDTIDISQYDGPNYVGGKPGNDTVYGGDGDDTIVAAGVFAANDTIDGGAGNDTLTLNGNYSAGVVFGAATLVNVEQIKLADGFSYEFSLDDANVAAGQTLTIDAHGLTGTNMLSVDGSQETNGNLTLLGGAGDDVLASGAGGDTLTGGGGNDTLNPGIGNDTVSAGGGNDSIYFGGGFTASDNVDGGSGTDTVYLDGNYAGGVVFGAGTLVNVERLNIAAGHSYKFTTADTTVASGATLTVDASALGAANTLNFNGAAESDGRFAVTGGAGNDTITGGAGNDSLTGGAGVDTLHLENGGNDTASAGDGNDRIYLGAAFTSAERVDGGAGTDSVYLDGDYSAGVTFNSLTLTNVEHLILAAGNAYTLTTHNATVTAGHLLSVDASALGAGDALVFSAAGDSDGRYAITAGAGDDVLTGGGTADIFHLESGGNDTVSGGNGIDKIYLGDTFTSADSINGGTADDYVWLDGDYSAGVTFGAATMINVEHLTLTGGHDYSLTMNGATLASGKMLTLDASALGAGDNLTFDGSAETNGRFTIKAGAGNGTIAGGGSNDTFHLEAGGADSVSAGGGNDLIYFGGALNAADSIDGGAGTDSVYLAGDYSAGLTFSSMTNVERITLGAGYNYNLTANEAAVAAGQLLRVDASALGLANAFNFNGAAETDGRFSLTGGAGDDTIIAGSGRDLITGHTGDDTLTGGGGNDHFYFSHGDGNDTITDFIAGNTSGDIVDLHGYGIANFAALQSHITQSGADTIIAFDAANSITLHNVTSTDLNSADFVFS